MVDVFFESPPTSKWDVLLPQIVLYSYKRFCMARLAEDASAVLIADPVDLSGGLPASSESLWSSQIELVSAFAPEPFKAFLEEWWKPEITEQVSMLEELDTYLRNLTIEFDTALLTDDFEKQNIIAELLEEDFYLHFQNWITDDFKEYFFFPSVDTDDDTLNTTLQKILELLKPEKKHTHKKTRRVNGKRSITPIRNSLQKIRKTRRNKQKQNEVLQISASSPSHGT
jgi:hypothetical protein